MAALGRVLAERGIANRSASVVLSNRFVRYALVPWRDAVTNRKERVQLARHCFRNIYGDTADGWEIRLSDGGFRRNAIASAVDNDFLAELRRVFAARRIELASVEPCFMSVCNRFRKEFESRDRACLAVVERGRATLGVFDGNNWQVLAARRVPDGKIDSLATVLTQELQSAGMDAMPAKIHVVTIDAPQTDTTMPGGTLRTLRLKALLGFSPIEDAGFAMALCGVA